MDQGFDNCTGGFVYLCSCVSMDTWISDNKISSKTRICMTVFLTLDNSNEEQHSSPYMNVFKGSDMTYGEIKITATFERSEWI